MEVLVVVKNEKPKFDQPIKHFNNALLYLYQRHPAKLDSFISNGESETEMYGIIGKSDDLSGELVGTSSIV